MARLNVAVEAACQKGLGVTGYEKDKGPTVDEDDAYLSIYVTDANGEPVSGLKKGSFTLTYLVPVGWGNPNVFVFFDDAALGLPGVYIFKLTSPVLAYRTTFGVEVKRRERKDEAGHIGFGMSTATKA